MKFLIAFFHVLFGISKPLPNLEIKALSSDERGEKRPGSDFAALGSRRYFLMRVAASTSGGTPLVDPVV